MSTLPSGFDAVNVPPAQPGFYAIIPASVRYCRDLPPAAKLLFGEIVALTSVKGYCFAQNPYFMELYAVSRATLKRWLADLSKQGFIRIEFVGEERRIFALAMMPEVAKKPAGGGAQKRATPGSKLSHPRLKNEPHSITGITKEIITKELLTRGGRFVGPGPVAARDLGGQEGKVTASPSTLKASLKSRQVERAVARCGDLTFRSRLSELWDVVEQAGCEQLWQQALDAVKSARNGSTGLVGGSAAYFCSFVSTGLGDVARA